VRRSTAPALLHTAEALAIDLEPHLREEITRGFLNDDPYDAFVGLLGMVNLVLRNQPHAPPLDDDVKRVEGWIFGQTSRKHGDGAVRARVQEATPAGSRSRFSENCHRPARGGNHRGRQDA